MSFHGGNYSGVNITNSVYDRLSSLELTWSVGKNDIKKTRWRFRKTG